jgi:PBSX family phage terminase large subunit
MSNLAVAPENRIVFDSTKIPWQIPFLRSKAKIILLAGEAGGGKSRVAAEKVHAYLMRYPKATGLVLRKTRESMTNSTVLLLDRTVIGNDPEVIHRDGKHRFDYNNGSLLAYGGMKDENQRDAIRSIGPDGAVDIIWMEEAIKFVEDDFNELFGRLRGVAAPWVQIILSTNTGSPFHWIYKRLIVGGEALHIEGHTKDNPYNPASYLDTLSHIGGVLGKRLREGRWVQAEGAIYGDYYDEGIHLIDAFPVPKEWRRFRVVDFGYEHPFVCQWWAIDGDGRMFRYREIYMTHRTVAVHAEQIKKSSLGERIEATICDHDAEDRATLTACGIPNRPATKAVSPGIQEVIQRLKVAGDGKPRLFLMKGALVEEDPALAEVHLPTCTEEEITLYSWLKGAQGQVKDTPRKEFDHGMDGTRYMAMELKSRVISSATKALYSW